MRARGAILTAHTCLQVSRPDYVEQARSNRFELRICRQQSALQQPSERQILCLKWRKEISTQIADIAMERLATADVSLRRPKGLTAEAWQLADQGWAKTYDGDILPRVDLRRALLAWLRSGVKSVC